MLLSYQGLNLVALLMLLSCQSEIPIEFDSSDNKYAISCIGISNEPIRVYAYSTQSLDNSNVSVMRDLKIQICQEGQLTKEAKLFEDSVYKFNCTLLSDADFLITDTVTHKQFTAKLERTSYVRISKAVHYPDIKLYDSEYGGWFNRIEVEFEDEPGVDNYYEVVLCDFQNEFCKNIIINSPVFSRGSQDYFKRTLFTDELFKDKSIKLPIYIYQYAGCKKVWLRNVSKSYYDYFTSLSAHVEAQNVLRLDDTPLDLFFRPLPTELYSNVEGALGVFASYTQSEYTL